MRKRIHWTKTEKGKKRLEELKADRQYRNTEDFELTIDKAIPLVVSTTIQDAIQLIQTRITRDEQLLADLKTLYTQLQGK